MSETGNSAVVQWLTEDTTLFELDWLTYLLGKAPENVINNPRQLNVYPKTILITNRHLPYRGFLDEIRYKQYKYGIILLSDENLTEPLEFLHDPSCLFLARNYINPRCFGHPKVTVFGLGYKKEFKAHINNVKTSKDRQIMWSFAGTLHTDRQAALDTFKDIDDGVIHTCSGFGAEDSMNTQQYANLLADSKFALCPPGQDSTDSFRMYEALEAGSIPVTLNNTTYVHPNRMAWKLRPSYWHGMFEREELPFIHGETWEEAKYQMQEVIRNGQIEQMQSDCMNLWRETKLRWKDTFTELLKS